MAGGMGEAADIIGSASVEILADLAKWETAMERIHAELNELTGRVYQINLEASLGSDPGTSRTARGEEQAGAAATAADTGRGTGRRGPVELDLRQAHAFADAVRRDLESKPLQLTLDIQHLQGQLSQLRLPLGGPGGGFEVLGAAGGGGGTTATVGAGLRGALSGDAGRRLTEFFNSLQEARRSLGEAPLAHPGGDPARMLHSILSTYAPGATSSTALASYAGARSGQVTGGAIKQIVDRLAAGHPLRNQLVSDYNEVESVIQHAIAEYDPGAFAGQAATGGPAPDRGQVLVENARAISSAAQRILAAAAYRAERAREQAAPETVSLSDVRAGALMMPTWVRVPGQPSNIRQLADRGQVRAEEEAKRTAAAESIAGIVASLEERGRDPTRVPTAEEIRARRAMGLKPAGLAQLSAYYSSGAAPIRYDEGRTPIDFLTALARGRGQLMYPLADPLAARGNIQGLLGTPTYGGRGSLRGTEQFVQGFFDWDALAAQEQVGELPETVRARLAQAMEQQESRRITPEELTERPYTELGGRGSNLSAPSLRVPGRRAGSFIEIPSSFIRAIEHGAFSRFAAPVGPTGEPNLEQLWPMVHEPNAQGELALPITQYGRGGRKAFGGQMFERIPQRRLLRAIFQSMGMPDDQIDILLTEGASLTNAQAATTQRDPATQAIINAVNAGEVGRLATSINYGASTFTSRVLQGTSSESGTTQLPSTGTSNESLRQMGSDYTRAVRRRQGLFGQRQQLGQLLADQQAALEALRFVPGFEFRGNAGAAAQAQIETITNTISQLVEIQDQLNDAHEEVLSFSDDQFGLAFDRASNLENQAAIAAEAYGPPEPALYVGGQTRMQEIQAQLAALPPMEELRLPMSAAAYEPGIGRRLSQRTERRRLEAELERLQRPVTLEQQGEIDAIRRAREEYPNLPLVEQAISDIRDVVSAGGLPTEGEQIYFPGIHREGQDVGPNELATGKVFRGLSTSQGLDRMLLDILADPSVGVLQAAGVKPRNYRNIKSVIRTLRGNPAFEIIGEQLASMRGMGFAERDLAAAQAEPRLRAAETRATKFATVKPAFQLQSERDLIDLQEQPASLDESIRIQRKRHRELLILARQKAAVAVHKQMTAEAAEAGLPAPPPLSTVNRTRRLDARSGEVANLTADEQAWRIDLDKAATDQQRRAFRRRVNEVVLRSGGPGSQTQEARGAREAAAEITRLQEQKVSIEGRIPVLQQVAALTRDVMLQNLPQPEAGREMHFDPEAPRREVRRRAEELRTGGRMSEQELASMRLELARLQAPESEASYLVQEPGGAVRDVNAGQLTGADRQARIAHLQQIIRGQAAITGASPEVIDRAEAEALRALTHREPGAMGAIGKGGGAMPTGADVRAVFGEQLGQELPTGEEFGNQMVPPGGFGGGAGGAGGAPMQGLVHVWVHGPFPLAVRVAGGVEGAGPAPGEGGARAGTRAAATITDDEIEAVGQAMAARTAPGGMEPPDFIAGYDPRNRLPGADTGVRAYAPRTLTLAEERATGFYQPQLGPRGGIRRTAPNLLPQGFQPIAYEEQPLLLGPGMGPQYVERGATPVAQVQREEHLGRLAAAMGALSQNLSNAAPGATVGAATPATAAEQLAARRRMARTAPSDEATNAILRSMGFQGEDLLATPSDITEDTARLQGVAETQRKARAQLRQARGKLPQRAISTAVIQIFQNMFGDLEGPYEALAEAEQAYTRLGEIGGQRQRATMKRDITAANIQRITANRDAAAVAGPEYAEQVERLTAKLASLNEKYDEHSQSVETLTKMEDEASEEVQFLAKTAVGTKDVLRNLGAGFVGGIAGGFVTMGVSAAITGVMASAEAMIPIVDRILGSGMVSQRMQQQMAEVFAQSGFSRGAVFGEFGQMGFSLERSQQLVGIMGDQAAAIAGVGQVQQRVDADRAALALQRQQAEMGLPAGIPPAAFASSGALLSIPWGPQGMGNLNIGGTESAADAFARQISAIEGQDQPIDYMKPWYASLFDAVVGRQQPQIITNENPQLEELNRILERGETGVTIEPGAMSREQRQFLEGIEGAHEIIRSLDTQLLHFEGNLEDINDLWDVIQVASGARVDFQTAMTRDVQSPAFQNQIWSIFQQRNLGLQMNQQNAGLQGLAEPILPFGTGIPGGGGGGRLGRIFNQSALLARQYEAGGLASLQESLGASLSPAGGTQLLEQASALSQTLDQLGRMQGKIQVGAAWRNYNEQLRVANLQLADLVALTGQGSGSHLGQLERQNMLLQRQAQLIQFRQQQRQINFGIAVAGFQSIGLTGEERAANLRIARLEARENQQLLDINRQTSGNQFEGTQIQNRRGLQSARFARDNLVASFAEGNRLARIQQAATVTQRMLGHTMRDISVMQSAEAQIVQVETDLTVRNANAAQKNLNAANTALDAANIWDSAMADIRKSMTDDEGKFITPAPKRVNVTLHVTGTVVNYKELLDKLTEALDRQYRNGGG